jgi:hypothetical protein
LVGIVTMALLGSIVDLSGGDTGLSTSDDEVEVV